MSSTKQREDSAAELGRFSFGRNWRAYSRTVSDAAVLSAEKDIIEWLGPESIRDRTVVDVGSGSGIHSLCFHRLGAKRLFSFDFDIDSVNCTRKFWTLAGSPSNWHVAQGSVLDRDFLETIGSADIVYSWGVLHHTGALWDAVDNVTRLAVNHGSRLWISIYAKGPRYPDDLGLKQTFNRSSMLKKRWMLGKYLYRRWTKERRRGRRFREWFWPERGMNAYHDAVDWLGGLPYEVATSDELIRFAGTREFRVERVLERNEGGCHVLLFRKECDTEADEVVNTSIQVG